MTKSISSHLFLSEDFFGDNPSLPDLADGRGTKRNENKTTNGEK